MSKLFLSVLNMSIAASWLVLAVLLLRLILKKAMLTTWLKNFRFCAMTADLWIISKTVQMILF